MATNPKVAHIYRRSNKLHRLDSRVYYYDNNFRGNMFYFEQSLLLTTCLACVLAKTAAPNRRFACQGPMCIVVEELFLRNCFKQDHLLVRRFCSVLPVFDVIMAEKTAPQPRLPTDESSQKGHRHEAAVAIILQYFQQRDRNSGVTVANPLTDNSTEAPLCDSHSLTRVLKRFGECDDFFPRFASGPRTSDVAFEEDLVSFVSQCQGHIDRESVLASGSLLATGGALPLDRIHIRLTNERDLTSLLLCDCAPNELNQDFVCSVLKSSPVPLSCRVPGTLPVKTFWRIDNIDEFRRISDSCFPRWTRFDEACFPFDENGGYDDQLFVLYTYMREVMLRNEDIDQLCNKCVFDGSYLYNKLMQQMREYLCHRFSVENLHSDWVDTLIARYRSLAHTANLYMLISSKTNIRVDMANDLKRSLKLSIKREKMQRADCSLSTNAIDMRDIGTPNLSGMNNYTGGTALNLPSSTSPAALCVKFPFVRSALSPADNAKMGTELPKKEKVLASSKVAPCVPASKRRKLAQSDSCDDVPAADLETNDKCDFVIKRCRSSKFRNLYTGWYPGRDIPTIVVASCNVGDINARQLITYDSQHLLQNVASAHFSDLEFVFEQVKRPRVTNQQNSSKCALMPRQSTRFLSAYNIGNMSVAGRTMNVCSRNSITFFVMPNRELCGRYYQWLNCVYDLLIMPSARDIYHRHKKVKCDDCFLRLMINEVPCAHFTIDKHYELSLFVLTKAWWPAVQFYKKTSYIISVTLISGVIVVPMKMVFDDEAVVRIDARDPQSLRYDCWLFCPPCRLYFPRFSLDRSSNLFFIDARHALELRAFRTTYLAKHRSFLLDDGGVSRCDEHTWFSPNDMQYYTSLFDVQQFSGRNENKDFYRQSLATPFFYEVACHGLFLNSKFVNATDISKLTVSINASKRRLRLRSSMFSDRLETLMDQNARMYVNDSPSPAGMHGQFQEPLHNIIGIPGENSFRCCFMFGDFRGRNCEDAYVFNRQYRPRLVNTIQLKVNYYLNDNAAIDNNHLRFHFAPSIGMHTGVGCTFFFWLFGLFL